MQLSVGYGQIVISWSIRIVWCSVQSSMAMVKDIWTIRCGSLLDWKCRWIPMILLLWWADWWKTSKNLWYIGRHWGKKIPNGSFFPRTRQGGADPVITEARLCFLRDIQARVFVLLQGVFFLGFWSMFKNNKLFFFIRMLFFRPRLNILIFLLILGWKNSCIILQL